MPEPIDLLQQVIYSQTSIANAVTWAIVLKDPMVGAGITTVSRIAAFLGQIMIESSYFSALEENLYYSSGQRIWYVFRPHFKSLEEASTFVKSPQKLANRVYANRLGNGDEASGDGWLYRGSGLIQITGKSEINACLTGLEVINLSPAAVQTLRTPAGAAKSACWYWNDHNLNRFADAGDIRNLTNAVNGPNMLGLTTRIKITEAIEDELNKALDAPLTA